MNDSTFIDYRLPTWHSRIRSKNPSAVRNDKLGINGCVLPSRFRYTLPKAMANKTSRTRIDSLKLLEGRPLNVPHFMMFCGFAMRLTMIRFAVAKPI
jgi:hypothetical protein